MIKKRIAVFASGSGSNAINLIHYFAKHSTIDVAFILTNKKDAPVIQKCEDLGYDVFVLSNAEASEGDRLASICQNQGIDYIVLAGYLRKIPSELISAYPEQIINIHPSLLPKFGGKGMFGQHVHQAVVEAKETSTGITIHVVNAEYDKGQIIAQFYTPVAEHHSAQDVDKNIRILEQTYFPIVVEKYIQSK